MEEFIGKKVIIRSKTAGVFFGELKSKNGSEVVLKNCRRIWYWSGAASLSQLANNGVAKECEDGCKFSVTVKVMGILGVNEIIQCEDESIKSIEGVKVWKI